MVEISVDKNSFKSKTTLSPVRIYAFELRALKHEAFGKGFVLYLCMYGYVTKCFCQMAVGVSLSVVSLCSIMDCSLPGSSVFRIIPGGTVEWVALPFSRRSSRPRDGTQVSCLAGRFFTTVSPVHDVKTTFWPF